MPTAFEFCVTTPLMAVAHCQLYARLESALAVSKGGPILDLHRSASIDNFQPGEVGRPTDPHGCELLASALSGDRSRLRGRQELPVFSSRSFEMSAAATTWRFDRTRLLELRMELAGVHY
jgi:hypothetical protein